MDRPVRDVLVPRVVGRKDLHARSGCDRPPACRTSPARSRREPAGSWPWPRRWPGPVVSRAASYGSPVSGKLTRSAASEKTRGTIAASCSSTSGSRPNVRASVRYWWSCRPRRRLASCTVAIGPAMPRSCVGMEALLARIEEHAVAVNVALVVQRLVWLLAVVERDGVGPHVLVAVADFLRVVPPVDGVPVEVHLHVVLEGGPDRRARVGGGRVDRDGAGGRTAAVVDPVAAALRLVRSWPDRCESPRSRVPDVDGAIESRRRTRW